MSGIGLRSALAVGLTAIVASGLIAPVAYAAPTLAQIQAQVRQLEEDATAAAEGAQAAKVQLATLNKTLTGIKQEAAAQGATVDALKKSLGTIAIEQYKAGGLSQGLELLFSANPELYLSSAGSLESITRAKSAQLRKFEAAEQRLQATTLTVNDKLALVKAAQKRFARNSALAKSKLAAAEKILAKLKKADRARLAALKAAEEDADQAASKAYASSAGKISGRAGVAIKYALKQIGDRYVFGAAGMITWDCSGLTMRAYQSAGVSLPHSSAAQSRYGRSVSYRSAKPGDLLFYGRPISHVAIYLGGGKMVHAPRSGSRVKVVSNAATALGSKRLVAVRRF
ncbi:Spr Cell wall-associated hydrolases (invasion-associated proteins) [Candidatus Nanopelagicaceae bacterium]|jgi:cell wall-associated NlpC family hydrolase